MQNLLAGREFMYDSAELLPTLSNCDLKLSLETTRSADDCIIGPDSKTKQFSSGYSA